MKLIEFTAQKRGAASFIARAINVSSVTIHEWAHGKKSIPIDRCPDVERATSGAVTCEELLPSVAWVRIPDSTWPNPAGRPLVDHTQSRKAA